MKRLALVFLLVLAVVGEAGATCPDGNPPIKCNGRYICGPCDEQECVDGQNKSCIVGGKKGVMTCNEGLWGECIVPCDNGTKERCGNNGIKTCTNGQWGECRTPVLLETSGKVTYLRVHDVGSGYGAGLDFLDGEVVIQLSGQEPGMAFGFKLRNDANLAARQGMLDLLRDAYKNDWTVFINHSIIVGNKNGEILRVWVKK